MRDANIAGDRGKAPHRVAGCIGWPKALLLAAICTVSVGVSGVAIAQVQPCPADRNCVGVAVGSPSGVFAIGETAQVPITFRPGDADEAPGGLDEIAAISLSVGIPGLELASCDSPDVNGLTSAFSVPAPIAESFWVFIENTRCGARSRCLCPGPDQTRDEFINIAISGPRELLAAGGTAEAPLIPRGELLTIALRVGEGAAATVPLHIFTLSDDPSTKPPFAGFLSIADNGAVDQTFDRQANVGNVRTSDGVVRVAVATESHTATSTQTATATATATGGGTRSPTPVATDTATPPPSGVPTRTITATPPATPGSCPGDCDGRGRVTVDELVEGIAIALGQKDSTACLPADRDEDGAVTIDELIQAVHAALGGCPP